MTANWTNTMIWLQGVHFYEISAQHATQSHVLATVGLSAGFSRKETSNGSGVARQRTCCCTKVKVYEKISTDLNRNLNHINLNQPTPCSNPSMRTIFWGSGWQMHCSSPNQIFVGSPPRPNDVMLFESESCRTDIRRRWLWVAPRSGAGMKHEERRLITYNTKQSNHSYSRICLW